MSISQQTRAQTSIHRSKFMCVCVCFQSHTFNCRCGRIIWMLANLTLTLVINIVIINERKLVSHNLYRGETTRQKLGKITVALSLCYFPFLFVPFVFLQRRLSKRERERERESIKQIPQKHFEMEIVYRHVNELTHFYMWHENRLYEYSIDYITSNALWEQKCERWRIVFLFFLCHQGSSTNRWHWDDMKYTAHIHTHTGTHNVLALVFDSYYVHDGSKERIWNA